MIAFDRIRRLVCAGSILADVRIEVPLLPPRGGDVIGSGATISAGGGFNILAAAARQGLATLYAGRHGTGPYGALIRDELEREGVPSLLPPSPERDSGFCVTLVEPDGERTFVTSPGVEAALDDRRLAAIPLSPQDAVFVSGYDFCYDRIGPALAEWIAAWPAGLVLVVDPGPLADEIPADILALVMPRVAIWTMNRREAGLMTGRHEPEAVRPRLRPGLSPDAMLIVRNGREGAAVMADARTTPFSVPAPEVAVRDSTGAGDTHTGTLIASLAEGLSPQAAIARANAAAALSVTRAGPATAPLRAELDRFISGLNPDLGRMP